MARPQGDLTLESLAERIDALEAGAPLRDVPAAGRRVRRRLPRREVPAAASGGPSRATRRLHRRPPARPHASAQRGPLDRGHAQACLAGQSSPSSRSSSRRGLTASMAPRPRSRATRSSSSSRRTSSSSWSSSSDTETWRCCARASRRCSASTRPCEYRLGRAGRSGAKTPTRLRRRHRLRYPRRRPPRRTRRPPTRADRCRLHGRQMPRTSRLVIAALGAEVLEDVTPDS